MKGKAKGKKLSPSQSGKALIAFVISLPSVGTNHIKFKGLERFISSQLLHGSTPSFELFNSSTDYITKKVVVNPYFLKVFSGFGKSTKIFLKIVRKRKFFPLLFQKNEYNKVA